MLRRIAEFAPSLVIVDALADSFAGDENNRIQARQFISMLRKPAIAYDCAFLAVAHPSLSGIISGRGTSGTTGWSNSVRARMYLETVEIEGAEPDPSLKVLKQPKANYAASSFEIQLRYENGIFVPVTNGEPLDQTAKKAQAEAVFMSILKRLSEQNRFVGPNPSINYAPKVFAVEPEATELRISKDQLRAAMVRLFQKKRICIEPYGKPSKGQTRIAEAPM
jgi:RecA-family ATPase